MSNRIASSLRPYRHVLPLVCILLLASPAARAGGWVATATQGFTLSNFTIPAQPLGPLPGSTPLQILVGLRLRGQVQLDSLINAVNTPGNPSYGHFLTPAQFAATYAPTQAEVWAVENYLRNSGFTHITAPANRVYVSAEGTAAQVEEAFNTPLWQYRVSGPNDESARTVYANTQTAEVPTSLGNIVLSVIGLENIDHMRTLLGRSPVAERVSVPTNPDPAQSTGTPANPLTFSPQDFWKVYDVGTVPAASNTIIAIIAEGDLNGIVPTASDPDGPNDLRQFEKENNLPQVPVVVIPTGLPSNDTSGAVEWDMDTQESTGMAGDVKTLYVYDASSLNDADLIPAFNAFATGRGPNGTALPLAQAASASFGGCETLEYLAGATQTYDVIFSEIAAQGQTQFASSGDSGSACGVVGDTNGVPLSGVPATVEYPASSMYVMGAGGTSLMVDSNYNVIQMTSWDAGGGGTSLWESSPPWQAPFVPTSTEGKGVPDVAMDADFLLSPAGFVSGGTDTTNGGTSLASPLSLGSWARLESAHDNLLGNAGPVLYSLSTPGLPFSTIGGMTDITVGSNGLYPATPGWDFDTGLGSFDISHVNELLVTPGTGSSGSAGSPCLPSGVTVVSQPAGNQTGAPANAEDDVTRVAFAEPFSAKVPTLVITMDIANLSALPALPPNTFWKVYFSYQEPGAQSAQQYFLDMDTNAPSGSPATPEFVYGVTVASANGSTDVSFTNPAVTGSYSLSNNTITFTIPTSLLIPPASGCSISSCSPGTTGTPPGPGSVLAGVHGETQMLVGAGAGLLEVIDTTPSGAYTLVGNAACNPKLPVIAELAATPTSGDTPLAVTLDAGTSHPPLAGGQINGYTFNFGDGSNPVTQTTPTVTHTYDQPGTFPATVTATDTGGGTGTSPNVVISAQEPVQPPTAALVATPTNGAAPLTVAFSASGSHDPNSGGSITHYSFNFGDGSAVVNQTSPTISHTYETSDNYVASVTVTDSENGTARATTNIAVGTASNTTPATGGSASVITKGSGGGGGFGILVNLLLLGVCLCVGRKRRMDSTMRPGSQT